MKKIALSKKRAIVVLIVMDMEQDWFSKYTTAAYVDLGVGNSSDYEEYTRKCAEWLNWKYEQLAGDWDVEDFLVVEPGQRIEASNDAGVLRAVNYGDPVTAEETRT